MYFHTLWLVCWLYWFYIVAVGDAHVFPGFLKPVLTQLSSKPPTTFLTYFGRGERRKKVRLNRVSNSQPPGHGSDTLTIEPPRRDPLFMKRVLNACAKCIDLCQPTRTTQSGIIFRFSVCKRTDLHNNLVRNFTK